MRHDAPYLVKRLAPPIGRPELPARVSVFESHDNLEEAVKVAHLMRLASLHPDSWSAQAFGLGAAHYFVDRRDAPATRPRRWSTRRERRHQLQAASTSSSRCVTR